MLAAPKHCVCVSVSDLPCFNRLSICPNTHQAEIITFALCNYHALIVNETAWCSNQVHLGLSSLLSVSFFTSFATLLQGLVYNLIALDFLQSMPPRRKASSQNTEHQHAKTCEISIRNVRLRKKTPKNVLLVLAETCTHIHRRFIQASLLLTVIMECNELRLRFTLISLCIFTPKNHV